MATKGKYQKTKTSVASKAVSKSKGKSSKKKTGAAAAVAAIAVVVLLVGFVGVYAFGSRLQKGDTIFPNVRVAGVDVGGLTALAAQAEVEHAVEESYASQVLQVQLPDKTLHFEPEQTGVALDVDAAIEKAVAYGKENGAFKALLNYLNSAGRGYDVELETALELDTEYIDAMIATAEKDARVEARNDKLSVSPDGRTITVLKGQMGRFLDTEGLFEAVYDAFQTGNFEPLQWDYVEIPYVEADLSQLQTEQAEEVQDAYYDPETKTFVEGSVGYAFDLAAAQAQLDAASAGAEITIQMQEVQPVLTAEELEEQMFGTQLELRSSPYVNNANRTENLRLACEAINGTIINPGEVFSFNQTVGERTEAKGYKPATIYGGEGESTDGVGGGICQVASTIYWAALYLDLETVMREPHMYLVTYVPAGMDATIYWDSGLDYKFRNNRENPIMITANTDGGYVNIGFWGVKENDNYVEMSNATLETWKDEDVEEVDETKEPGYRAQKQTAYTGYKVEAYQKVYDGSGKLLKEKTIYSTYKSRPNIYIVGPSEEELPPEEEWPLDPDDPFYDQFPDVDNPWDDFEEYPPIGDPWEDNHERVPMPWD